MEASRLTKMVEQPYFFFCMRIDFLTSLEKRERRSGGEGGRRIIEDEEEERGRRFEGGREEGSGSGSGSDKSYKEITFRRLNIKI